MRFVIDLTRLNRHISGMERYAMMISYQMIKNSKNDDFVLFFRDNIYPLFNEFANNENVKCIVINHQNNFIFDMFVLPFNMSKIKADYYLFLAFPVPILFFKKNSICTIHDLECWDYPETMIKKFVPYFKLAFRLSALKCQKILTVSNFSKRRIIDILKYPEDRIYVIYNGVSEKFYQAHSNNNQEIKEKYHLPDEYLLCLSLIQPRKNMGLLLEACNELWSTNELETPLVIAGKKGWNYDTLLNINTDKVIFTGYIDDDDLPYIYQNAKAFIFPSLYEGFGIPPLEAMASKTCVLSSDGPCMPEILQDAAIYFKNNDLADLKEKIIFIDKYNNDLIDRGLNQALKYRWDNEAIKLLNILKEDINEKHI